MAREGSCEGQKMTESSLKILLIEQFLLKKKYKFQCIGALE